MYFFARFNLLVLRTLETQAFENLRMYIWENYLPMVEDGSFNHWNVDFFPDFCCLSF